MDEDAQVNAAILKVLMPQLYAVIDGLLSHAPDAPKPLVIQAKRLLPSSYANSFEKKLQEKP